MRFAGFLTLIAIAVLLIVSCGNNYSGKVDKSGAAGPQNPALGDAPPPGEGPAAIEVHYTEQVDGVTTRDILLKNDTTFIITLHGYASKEAKEKTTRRWDTNLKDVQTGAIMEGCSYEIMTSLKGAMATPTPSEGLGTLSVRFANDEEIVVQTSYRQPPPNDFRAIAHALTELAKEKVLDKRIKPTDVVS